MAAQLGYCGLDKRRQPLTGDEIRGCWEALPNALLGDAAVPPTIAPAGPADDAHPPLAFVEVASAQAADADVAPADQPDPPPPAATTRPVEPGWNLWGDLDA